MMLPSYEVDHMNNIIQEKRGDWYIQIRYADQCH